MALEVHDLKKQLNILNCATIMETEKLKGIFVRVQMG